MKITNLFAFASAMSLAVAPVAAQAAPVVMKSSNTPVLAESQFGNDDDKEPYWIAALVGLAIVVGVILLVDNDDDEPVSP